jgi:hypothetical protein
VKILSAILFAVGATAAGLVDEILHMHRDPNYSPELGLKGAVIGLALFGVIYGVMIYAYGAASRKIRKESEQFRAYALSAIVGIPFWFIILPLHRLLRDSLGLSDNLWWIEAACICGVSFEIIRILHAKSKKTA